MKGTTSMEQKCPHCGVALPEDASFCLRCARSVRARKPVKAPARAWRKGLKWAVVLLLLAAVPLVAWRLPERPAAGLPAGVTTAVLFQVVEDGKVKVAPDHLRSYFPLLSGIIPILTLLCITMIISVLTMRSVRFRALLCGRPSIIVEDGAILQREMKRNRFTVDELMEELRLKGITDISTVKYAILETNGQISVLPRAGALPVTASQMGIQAAEPGLPLVIINDGRILDHNLRARGLNRAWLERQLAARKIASAAHVFLLTVDGQNQVYLAAKDVTAK